MWSHGVMVSTQDSESCNPSSNLGGTFLFILFFETTLPFLHHSLDFYSCTNDWHYFDMHIWKSHNTHLWFPVLPFSVIYKYEEWFVGFHFLKFLVFILCFDLLSNVGNCFFWMDLSQIKCSLVFILPQNDRGWRSWCNPSNNFSS